jgi:hypothetical protein
MIDPPELSMEEWALLLQLLERERGDLPVEIRHTRTRSVRDELRRREEMVDDLLQRLRAVAMN